MGPVDLVVPHWMRGQATTSHLAVAGSSHTPGSDPSTASSSPLLSISDAGSPTPGQGTASTPGSIEAPYWESDPRSLGPHPEDSTPPRVLLVGFGSGTSPGPESGLGALFLNPRPLTLTAREWRVVVDIDVVEIGDRVRAIGETVATLTQELKPLTEKDTRLKPSYFDIKRAAKVARELEEAAGEMREYLPVNRARRGYLVVSQDREYYAGLEVFDKETCRQRPMLICPPSFPLVHRSVKECISSIYFQNSDAAEICEWSVLVQPPAAGWRWEAASQKWYYSLSQPVVLTEQCPDEAAVEITLTGSGVIQPQIQCTLRTATHKLLPAGGNVPAQHFLRNRTIDVPTLWSLNATQLLEDKNLDAIVDRLRQQGQVQPGVWSEDEIRLEAALRMLEENEGNGPALVYGLGGSAVVLLFVLGLGLWWYRRTCRGVPLFCLFASREGTLPTASITRGRTPVYLGMGASCFIFGVLLITIVSAKEFAENVELHEAHQSLQRRSVIGGLKEVEVSENDLVKELSELAVKTLDDVDEDNVRRTVIDILDAKKQLVNGIMYHLELKIQDTSCLEDEDITYDDSCLSRTRGNPRICKIRMHRSFADKSPHNAKVVSSECKDEFEVVGAITEAKANSDYIHAMANFAMDDLNGMSNSVYWYKLAEILEAKTQVANGMNTFLTVELHSTNCLKNDKYKSDKVCGVDPDTLSKMVCHLVVWEQPWKNKKQVKKSSCSTLESPKLARNSSKKSKRSVLGAEESVADVNDQKIEEMKHFLSLQLTARANSDFIKKVVAVLNSTTQVVSGKLTRATVRVADTDCLKSENRSPSECTLSSQGHQICSVTILEQPWVNRKELTQSECHAVPSVTPHQSKIKRMAKVLGLSTGDKDLLSFSAFVNRESRLYKTDEEMRYRFHVFRANMLKAAYLNKTEQGTATYGATMFADMTKSEFKQYTGLVYNPNKRPAKLPKMAEIPDIDLPDEFDWRDSGVVTPVKNQGSCGSCWAFSVTGNIEGLYAIANKELLSFSEQELVDCDKLDNGCNGGFFNTAFESIEEMGGLELEKDYPYLGKNEKCHLDKSEIKVSVKDYVNISSDESEMAKFLVQTGPISIALNANAMQFYMGGVSHPLRFLCNPDDLDHGVLIVGYGVHRTKWTHKLLPYWLIKNSWGPRWGNKGYYMAYRGDGTCGLNKAATSAILE
ncbi:hypothetical protein GE061_006897 [Apolygus lucorum]|uniref:Cathepsin F n=1 Tax=Apolygus lucorum TaxID=248454 RepID=A0A8S9WRL9_APOLU|nr:hypothetical protein GE061_006897 [Apolygus lucorum]